MTRNFVLAAAVVAGGFALAAPTAASAGNFSIGVDVGPGYDGYYQPVYHRGYRHRYDRPRRYYGGGYRFAPPRPYFGYARPYRPRCRVVTVRSWNGYRYVTRTRETCGRRYGY